MKNPNEEIAMKGEQTVKIPVDMIRPSPTNPRKTFAEGPLRELADNIQAQGQIQPGVVRLVPARHKLIPPDIANGHNWQMVELETKRIIDSMDQKYDEKAVRRTFEAHQLHDQAYYELVVGERRWRACKLAGLPTYQAIVRELTDSEAEIIQQIENLQREDLTPIEEGQGYKRLVESGAETVESLGKKLHKSRSHIYAMLKLTTLPPVAMTAFREKMIDISLAQLVAMIPHPKQQEAFLKQVMDGGEAGYDAEPGSRNCNSHFKTVMSFRKAKALLYEDYLLVLKKDAPFDVKDTSLLPNVPACADCPKRTGNCKEAFPDITNPNVCTDVHCYKAKAKATLDKAVQSAVDKGAQPLKAKDANSVFSYYTSSGFNNGKGWFGQKEICELDPKGRTFSKLGDELGVEPFAAVDRHGKVKLAFKLGDIQKAAVAAGVKLKAPKIEPGSKEETPEQKAKREFAERLEKDGDEAVGVALVEWVEKQDVTANKFADWLTEKVAAQLMANDWSTKQAIMKRRGWDGEKCLSKLKPAELRGVVVELLLRNYHGFDPQSFDVMLKVFPAVDEKAIRKVVKERLEKEEKPVLEKVQEIIKKVKGGKK